MERLFILALWKRLERRWQKGTFEIKERSTAPHVTVTGLNRERVKALRALLPGMMSPLTYEFQHHTCRITFPWLV